MGDGTTEYLSKAKGKGKGRGNQEEDIVMLDAPIQTGPTADERVQASIISINRLDILKPPLPLIFGKYNNRPLNEKEARILHGSMVQEGFSPFRYQNMIPLVIAKDAIDPACIHTTVNDIEDAPLLKLTETGGQGAGIIAAGGRHRHRVVELEFERMKERIAKLKTVIAETSTAEGRDGDEMLQRMSMLRNRLRETEERKNQVGIWGVIIFDAGDVVFEIAFIRYTYTEGNLQR